jgi:hypothetical protein
MANAVTMLATLGNKTLQNQNSSAQFAAVEWGNS